jgi:hypothetical protein
MILQTVGMENQNNFKKYYVLSDSINIIFIVGYIVDFIERKSDLVFSLKYASALIFTINLALIIYTFLKLLKNKDIKEYHKKVVSIFIRLFLNIIFLFLIFLL